MKTTYLIYKPQADGSVSLSVATCDEWADVAKANKQLPPEKRRYFILDHIMDGDDLDRMVIEAPFSEYQIWIRGYMADKRNREAGRTLRHLSLDAKLFEQEGAETLLDVIPSKGSAEECAFEKMLMENLRSSLSAWKPWANDLLDAYLQGEKRACTERLAQKYGVSVQVIRKYKRQFEVFVKKFLEGVSF